MSIIIIVGATNALAKVEISIWHGEPEFETYLNAIVPGFEKKYPGVSVKVTQYPFRALDEKLTVAMPVGQASDIVYVNTMESDIWYKEKLARPVPEDLAKLIEKIYPPYAIRAGYEASTDIPKKMTAVPMAVYAKCLFYNVDHFREAGLSGPPETVDESMEYARKLSKYGANDELTRGGMHLRLSGGGIGIGEKFWLRALIPFGATAMTPVGDKWVAGFDDERGQDGLQFYMDALYKYRVIDFKIKADMAGFAAGVISMVPRELWVINWLKENGPDINYDLSLMPKGPGHWGTIGNLYSWMVPTLKGRKEKKEVWDFIRFSLEKESLLKLFELADQPLRTDVDYSPVYKIHPAKKVFMDSLTTPGYAVYPYESTLATYEIYATIGEYVVPMFKDKKLASDREALKKSLHVLADEVNRILDEYGLLYRGE